MTKSIKVYSTSDYKKEKVTTVRYENIKAGNVREFKEAVYQLQKRHPKIHITGCPRRLLSVYIHNATLAAKKFEI